MEAYDVYRDISERTGGDIYVGVAGPVRTGKSTFIKNFIDLLVLPNIDDAHAKERVIDELPQSGAGKTIMTTQPRFVPNEAIGINVDDKASLKVRMVDCVGYMVEGALGHMEGDAPRMVRTPWSDKDIPFEEAAEIGTRKVIEEHSTIGIVMTTDGSICDIPRQNYVSAEERAVKELKSLGKPYVIVLNSKDPNGDRCTKLRDELVKKYCSTVVALNVMDMSREDINSLLKDILYEFPAKQVNIDISKWVCALNADHWLFSDVLSKVNESAERIFKVRDHSVIVDTLKTCEHIKDIQVGSIRLGEGIIEIKAIVKEELFYTILGEECGYEIKDDGHLITIVKDLVNAKKEYSRLESAITSVKTTGYGIVPPRMDELSLEEPELVQQGNKFGVRLKASAPSLHIIKVGVDTEVSPIIGTEKQSEEMINYMLKEFENDPAKIWATDIFGKSLHDVVKEGLSSKLTNIPEDARFKMQETLERIVNEGNAGMLCILL